MNSKFLSRKYYNIKPYRLGEQPKDRHYIKLNSNESPYPLPPSVVRVLQESAKGGLGYYSDQDGTVLREALAEHYGIHKDQFFVGNGADEVLSFCFLAYGMEDKGLCYPDITYGFYRVFANAYGVDATVIPLTDQFQISLEDYKKINKTVVFPNPNAPTGKRVSMEEIEDLLFNNEERIVIVDEAYVDFETESCIGILERHPNLIVVHTMSKSRNIAGLHVGYAAASKEIIADLNALKNCFNPNNVNQVTLDAAVAVVKDEDYMRASIAHKVKTRNETKKALEGLEFQILDSYTNFLFVTHPNIYAADLEKKFKDKGILTRYYAEPRIDNFLRITIGSEEDMKTVIREAEEIVKCFV